MEHRRLVERLRRLPIAELVAVLGEVFDTRRPSPEDSAFCRNRFFLGIASSDLESDGCEPERWGPWEIEAVAYPDPAHYGGGLGPESGDRALC
jgi:hypothetical protein